MGIKLLHRFAADDLLLQADVHLRMPQEVLLRPCATCGRTDRLERYFSRRAGDFGRN